MSNSIEDIRKADADLIISAISGLIDEPDQSHELIIEVNSWPDGLKSANVWSRDNRGNDTTVARFAQPDYLEEVYEIFGQTPVAESAVAICVFGINGNPQETFYYLRNENVNDEHRIKVVRQALGLESS